MASDWRDKMMPATFRGVPFNVISAEIKIGRRLVRHVYPKRDKTFSEDLGRLGRDVPIEAFLVGDDFLDQVEDLIEALETPGPGELVHPWFGTRNVVAGPSTIRVSASEGGYAQISIPFDETDEEAPFPTTKIDAVAKIGVSAEAALAAVSLDLSALHNLTGLGAAAVANVAGVIRSAGAQMNAVLGPIVSGVQEVAALKAQIDRVTEQASALARAPAEMFELVAGVIVSLVPDDPRAAVLALLQTYGFTPTTARAPATTLKKIQERITFDVTQQTIQRVALIQAARLAVDGSRSVAARAGGVSSYPSFEDAVGVRDLVITALDEQLGVASDLVFPVLMQLRADLVRALPGEDSGLPHLKGYVPKLTVPSLVLSHRLYGHLDGEADLIARNRIRHPGFVSGGRLLEVLSVD